MPRLARAFTRTDCYHALSRGNEKATIFYDDNDYADFVDLMDRASARHPIELFAYCLMPNHFHFAVRASPPRSLSRWMHTLLTSHSQRFRAKYGGAGHVWQGRYKTFAVQQDEHLMRVLRYVERNPVTGGLVRRAEDWPWSSARERHFSLARVSKAPVSLPPAADWLAWVNEALSERELHRLRENTTKGTPYGDASWIAETVNALGLGATMRPRGRPRTTLSPRAK